MNRFVKLQNSLRDLLAGHPYFAGVEILTEELADLEGAIAKSIINANGFGVVVTTARGQRHGDPDATELTPLVLTEQLVVSIIHNPLLALDRNVLDALDAAIDALAPDSDWRVINHEFYEDTERGCVSQNLLVSTLMVT